MEDLFSDEARKLQAACYENQLPVDRWRAITAEARAKPLLVAVARRITSRFEAITALASRWNRFVVASVSVLGAVVPFALVIFGLYALLRNLVHGRIEGGFELLGVIVPIILLFDALLHSLVGLADSGREARSARGKSGDDLADGARATLGTWVAAYRHDLEADLADLRLPVVSIRTALDRTRDAGLDATREGRSAAASPTTLLPAAPGVAPDGTREAHPAVAGDVGLARPPHSRASTPPVAPPPRQEPGPVPSIAQAPAGQEPAPPGPDDGPFRPLQRYRARS